MLVKYTRTSIVDDESGECDKLPAPTPAKLDAETADALKNELPGKGEPKFLYCHGTYNGIPSHVKLHDSIDRELLKKHGMSMTCRKIAFPYTMSAPVHSGRVPTAKQLGTDEITLWCDGSQAYTGNGAIAFGSCGIAYAFSLIDDNGDEKRYGYSGAYVDTSASNTDAEVMAAASGIREAICRGYKSIEVRYDAMSIVDSICTPGGTDTQCCFNSFLCAASRYADITFTHVKGHSGITMNEYVDKLAKDARNAGIKFYSPLMKDTLNDVTLSIPIIDQMKPGNVTQVTKERNRKFEKALSKLPNLPGMQAHRRKNGSFDYLSALTAVVGQSKINESFRDNVARYPYQKASGIGESGGKIIRMFVSGMTPKVVNAERKRHGIQDVSDLPAIMSQSTWILTRGAMRANSVQALVSGALSYSSGIPFTELQQSVIDAVDAEQRRIDENRKRVAASQHNKRTRKAEAKKRQSQQLTPKNDKAKQDSHGSQDVAIKQAGCDLKHYETINGSSFDNAVKTPQNGSRCLVAIKSTNTNSEILAADDSNNGSGLLIDSKKKKHKKKINSKQKRHSKSKKDKKKKKSKKTKEKKKKQADRHKK